MTFARIVCPIDFSDTSSHALQYAAAIARYTGADLHLLHAVSQPLTVPPWMVPERVALTPTLHEQIAKDLHQFVGEIDLPAERCHEAVLLGRPDLVIPKQVDELGADLLVLGTHGRTGAARALLGSVAEHVLHHVSCPVLTVPPKAPEPFSSSQVQFKRVLAAVDFSPVAAAVARQAFAFAEEAGDPVTLLHVIETLTDQGAAAEHMPAVRALEDRKSAVQADLRMLLAEVAPEARECDTRVELGRPGQTIVRVANELGSELIVMGAQGHRGPALAFLGSATQEVVRAAACPVLTVKTGASGPSV